MILAQGEQLSLSTECNIPLILSLHDVQQIEWVPGAKSLLPLEAQETGDSMATLVIIVLVPQYQVTGKTWNGCKDVKLL